MGKQNRRRRTGRKTVPGLTLDADALSGDPARIAEAIATAALAWAQGDSAGVRRFLDRITGHGPVTEELATGTHRASERLIAHAFEFGWLPADVHQAARRRVDKFAVGYLTDLMAEHRAPFAADSVDETWQRQLDDLDATVWWTADRPHLNQWADRALLTGHEALTTVIEALALLVGLPKLERIRPLPGTARPHTPPHSVDEKTLGRIRGLLAKAESTAFPEEAETLSAKAQELMTKYAINRVVLETPLTPTDLPTARRIWLDTPYTEAKALLIDMVTRANRCRTVFAAEWGFVTIVGDDPDLQAVELLSTSLLVQATRTMIDTNSTTDQSRTRAYRKAFLTAYATRIGDRLTTVTEATIAEADSPKLLPILATHQQRVDKAVETYFPTTHTRGITIRSPEGWDAGTEAADRAHLDNG
ncbi:DUF2786 domain-containing protein [Nocardia mangyaensis]|uniref:DUF2786 domain-containing protein n=1 Tax=Nocardia mangyaensis TaxID=2213200 RepID=UPI00267684D1|nr:DUF2786 domain-containing protein [Nocardia mangyaensis]MDO3649138.1 DUF2786 domain-containing protein [Nocardia mangyaensis]